MIRELVLLMHTDQRYGRQQLLQKEQKLSLYFFFPWWWITIPTMHLSFPKCFLLGR